MVVDLQEHARHFGQSLGSKGRHHYMIWILCHQMPSFSEKNMDNRSTDSPAPNAKLQDYFELWKFASHPRRLCCSTFQRNSIRLHPLDRQVKSSTNVCLIEFDQVASTVSSTTKRLEGMRSRRNRQCLAHDCWKFLKPSGFKNIQEESSEIGTWEDFMWKCLQDILIPSPVQILSFASHHGKVPKYTKHRDERVDHCPNNILHIWCKGCKPTWQFCWWPFWDGENVTL